MTEHKEKADHKLQAVILAAGYGKRMRSNLAKVLHPVLGKPMIWRMLKALNQLNEQGIKLDQIHIVVGHNSKQVKEYINKCLESKELVGQIHFHEQEKQLGTGHALMTVQETLKNFMGDILVLPGDCPLLNSEILASLIFNHRQQKNALSVISTTVKEPTGYGRILRSAQGHVLGIVEEKDASEKQRKIQEINAAIYCFNWPAIAKGLSELGNNNKQGEYYLPDLVAWSSKVGHTIGCTPSADWRQLMGVNSRADLEEANRFLNDITLESLMNNGITIVDRTSTWISPEVKIGQDTTVLPGCYLVGDIKIGDACIIGPHTFMSGKIQIGEQTKIMQSCLEDCEIGNNCHIGPFAHLRANTILANQIRVGNFVELKKSQIDSDTNVSHLSYIGDTTIGKNANVGAGAITANYDHLTKKKANTVIEDGVSIGSNAVLVAPVKLGKESVVGACTVVTKDVEAGALAVGRAKQTNVPDWTEKRRKTKTDSQ